MKRTLRTLALTFLALAGCTDSAKPPTPIGPKVAPREVDPFRQVIDTFRYPENPRGTDDWTRFSEGCQQLAAYFARPEVQERLKLSAAERKFLENDVHLTEEEMAEVDSTTFRAADAHYLDECFLLRDAAHFLDQVGLSPTEQLQRKFRWVMRNVYLCGQDGSWTPPAFTLRRGYGSALERGLVFLALLRQSNREGCMIVLPQAMPTQYLVAVLDEKTSDLHLFDPRLGLALPGKDGAGVATLKEALADPKLLGPAAIGGDDVKKLEAWLVCPLYALSPRILEMQKGLSGHDAITLHLDAPRLRSEIEAASNLPVKVWNAARDNQTTPNSPTRALRRFLPRQEGGVDDLGRAQAFRFSLTPADQVMANYGQPGINLRPGPGLMPDKAYLTLLKLTEDLFDKYELQTREMYLRGLAESILRRYERLQAFTRNDALNGIAGKESFRKDLARFQEQLREANARIVNSQGNAKLEAQAHKDFQGVWNQDPFVLWLLNVESEQALQPIPANQEQKGKDGTRIPVLTGILAIGVRDYFERELARNQACLNEEKAEREQAKVLASAKPTKNLQTRAHDAWELAKSSWSSFYVDRIVLDSMIAERMRLISQPAFEQDAFTLKKIGLLELLQKEIHEYFEAKLRLAECTQNLDGKASAQAYLKLIKVEIEQLEKKDPLGAEIKKISDKVKALQPKGQPRMQAQAALAEIREQRIERLASDWGPGGAFFWLKRSIDTQLGTVR